MEEADEGKGKREDERQMGIMVEDPLNVNYARWSTGEGFKKNLTEVSLDDCSVE